MALFVKNEIRIQFFFCNFEFEKLKAISIVLLFISCQFIAVTTILDYDKIVYIAIPENKNRKYFN